MLPLNHLEINHRGFTTTCSKINTHHPGQNVHKQFLNTFLDSKTASVGLVIIIQLCSPCKECWITISKQFTTSVWHNPSVNNILGGYKNWFVFICLTNCTSMSFSLHDHDVQIVKFYIKNYCILVVTVSLNGTKALNAADFFNNTVWWRELCSI